MTKRLLALTLALVLVLCTGCTVVLPSNGTLALDSSVVKEITVRNGSSGYSFAIQSRDDIYSIVKYLNSYTLETKAQAEGGSVYTLTLTDEAGKTLDTVVLVDEAHLFHGQNYYEVNTKDLLTQVQKLECDTLTDKELIDLLLQENTLAQLNILDEDGKLSMDKILGLADACPALFELISRPSIIETLGGYGVEAIQNALETGNAFVQEKVTDLAELLKQYFPDLSDKIDAVLPE